MRAAAPAIMRSAAETDAGILFEWLNSPDSRAVSLRTTTPTPWDTHVAWFQRMLGRIDAAIWIAECDGDPVGQVRLEQRDGSLEVSLYVAPAARGCGVGRLALAHAQREATSRWPGKPLVARVKHENTASQNLFVSAGFQMAERKVDHVVLKKGSMPLALARSNY